jgi:MGT family glycosyltransferase
MPHIAIVMPGAHGHINPTIAVARELVQKGARVSYLFTPMPTLEAKFIMAELQATGATVYPYPSHFQFKRDGETPRESWAAFPRRILEDSIDIAQRIESTLLQLRPDLIVHDFLCLAGRIAGHALQLPTLTFFPTYPMNEHFPQSHIVPVDPRIDHPDRVAFRKLVQEVTARWGLPAFTDDNMFVPSQILNIAFMPREFHPAGHTFDSRFVFVGPSLQPRISVGAAPSAERSQPLCYVSLGTLFSKQPACRSAIASIRRCSARFPKTPASPASSISWMCCRSAASL